MTKLNLNKRYCIAISKSGRRCKKSALINSEFCAMHDPLHAEQHLLQVQIANGNRSPDSVAKPIEVKTVDDMLKAQSIILERMMKKRDLTSKEVQAFATISRSFLSTQLELAKMDRLTQLEKKTKHLT